MKKTLLILQFVVTLLILAFIQDNYLKMFILLPVWWFTFKGLSRREWIAFLIINLLFVVSDIGAIKNNFFQFSNPDFLELPVWEFFMWGFYLLHTHRMFPPKVPKTIEFKILLLAIVFSQMFAVIPDRDVLLVATTSVLALTLFFYHEMDDFLYCGYLMLLGIAVEYVGLRFQLWSYPEKDFNSALVQFVIMWGASGVYFRHLMAGFLLQPSPRIHVFKQAHSPLPIAFQKDFEMACALSAEKKFTEAAKVFADIEAKARLQSQSLNYEFYARYSLVCTIDGNLRMAAELSREALLFTTSNLEQAYMHLQLCRIYRMMILMNNARFELKAAFSAMNLEAPKNSLLQTLKALIASSLKGLMGSKTVIDEKTRHALQIEVALYEEAGLSAYYFVEYFMLAQCSIRAKHPAFQLGNSIQMVNWLGGSGCVWVILGRKAKAQKLIAQALEVGEKIPFSYGITKARLWEALFLNYQGRSKDSAEAFSKILSDPQSDLSPYDHRLCATTLSCNLLARGHMRDSEACIRDMTSIEVPRSRYFSSGKAFVDWYRLPALGFLGDTTKAETVLKNSQVVFHRVDEEKWQITQFLGGLLTYYYSQPQTSLKEITACLERFETLELSPRLTYVEAAQIWIAKAHLFVDLASRKVIPFELAKEAVQQLGKAKANPDLNAHWLISRAKLSLLEGSKEEASAENFCERASASAKTQNNIWVEYEILRYRWMKANMGNRDSAAAANAKQSIERFCNEHGWKGMHL